MFSSGAILNVESGILTRPQSLALDHGNEGLWKSQSGIYY